MVTAANVNYEGSLSISADLAELVELEEYERILVGNMANGEQFETYVIYGLRGVGAIELNEAIAHLGKPGDRLTIMSFGLFNGDGGLNALLFSLVAAAIVTVLIYWLSRVESPLLAVAIGLIIGGAIGNVIDRIRLGAVVDFLDFHAGSWHWPAFNVADSAICIGVAVMLLDGLLLRREAH